MLAISMVMVRVPDALALGDVLRDLAEHHPDLPAPTEQAQENGALSFRLGDVEVVIGRISSPIPAADLEGPCATSILWPKAAEEVAAHQAHWVVTVHAPLDPIAQARVLTQITAAVVAACPQALGVYWGNATLVIPRALFLDFAREVLPQELPVPMWVDFRAGRDSPTTSTGFTQGLAALGHLEIEAEHVPEEPGELRERLMALAAYLLDHGPVIADGDTVGSDAGDRIRVVHGASVFGHEGTVMRLEFEAPDPAPA